MSAVCPPQHLADPVVTDSGESMMKFELMEELDVVHRCEDRVEQTLAALRDCDAAGGYGAERSRLLEEAADAVWRLVVHHEACDCCDHNALIARYHIPSEVMARIGSMH